MHTYKQSLSIALAWAVMFMPVRATFASQVGESPSQATLPAVTQTPEQLQQLVAPIALYPDALVSQIMAAATYPEQIVQAERWMQEHPDLKGEALAQQVDTQPWDPAVKALVEFPAVLANMDRNLSWTSALGDAYINQEQEVMSAVQVMRQRARQAGNLQSTPQQQVMQNGTAIEIGPADPQVVYVPQYDPWLAYGAPIAPWPGWYGYPGLFIDGPGIGFGLGFGVGLFGGFGWGFHHWGADWHHSGIFFNHARYFSHGRGFVHRDYYANRRFGDVNRNGAFHNGGAFRGDRRPGPRPGAGGVHHGMIHHGASAFHGGAAFHGGGFHRGGGFHGGSRGGGGHHR